MKSQKICGKIIDLYQNYKKFSRFTYKLFAVFANNL